MNNKHNNSTNNNVYKNVIKIINILKNTYPDAKCSLDFKTPFELGIAVMLSAQCTDERVNKTTPSIFKKYNTPQDFINIDIKLYKDGRHEILNELNYEDVYNDIYNWCKKVLEA